MEDENLCEVIEDRRIVRYSTTHIISEEGVNKYKIPTYDTRDEQGEMIKLAAYEGQYYKIESTLIPKPHPVPKFKSGRNSGRQDDTGPEKDVPGQETE